MESAIRVEAPLAGRWKMQDYQRTHRFLSSNQWSRLACCPTVREKGELLSEAAWSLGCRAPSEETLGLIGAFKEDSSDKL